MSLIGWKYSKEVIIDNTNNDNSYENTLICINLSFSNFDFSKARFDGSDIRFVDSDGVTSLDYWIEKYDYNNQEATIYVKVPLIPANQTKSIYMYYGNMNAVSRSDQSIINSEFQYNPDPFNDSSCLAFYPLDGNANDYSGNGNDAVIHGNVGFTTGKLGQAVDYVNKTENDYIVTTNPIQRHGSKEITVCGWINVAGHTGNWISIWHLSPDNTNDESANCRQPGLWLYEDNNSRLHVRNDGVTSRNLGIDVSQGSITYNQWHFICQVVTLRQMKLYIDGQLTDTYNSNEDFKFNDGWFYIGTKWISKNHLIDHVRVFNRALTEDEIQTLYITSHPTTVTSNETRFSSRLAGTIVDSNGNPITGKNINVYTFADFNQPMIMKTTTTTGNWEFNDFPADPGAEVLVTFESKENNIKLAGASYTTTQES